MKSRQPSQASHSPSWSKQHPRFVAIVVLCAIVLGLFLDVVLSPDAIVLSHQGADGDWIFIPWREFGFGQLRQGNLALWNPRMLSGCPNFGNFQIALLYPPNWLYLVLPIDRAVNLDMVLHILLAALLMFAWSTRRGLSPLASLVSSLLLVFGGPCFFHLYPGHVSPLAVMAWAPLLLLVCDGLLEKPSLNGCLLGVFAVAMQILAGYPQFFFYTAIAAGIYFVLSLPTSGRRAQALLGFVVMYLGGVSLASVQLLAGLDAAAESVRGNQGLSFGLASMLSFPPENLVTLIAPDFFGNMSLFPYWGRWYLWEMSLFMGVTGITLACCGLLCPAKSQRRAAIVAAVCALILFVLALGAYTPLFRILYDHVPGFNRFRSNSKFIYLASIFVAQLAGLGLDRLIVNPRRFKSIAVIVLSLALVTGVCGVAIHSSAAAGAAGAWTKIVASAAASGETYLQPEIYQAPGFANAAGAHAANQLFVSSAIGMLVAIMLLLARVQHRRIVHAIACLAVLELLVFAWRNRPTFELAQSRYPTIEQFLKDHPGDYRSMSSSTGNNALSMKIMDIGGYEPFVTRRYAEFMFYTQGKDPDQADAYVSFAGYHPLYSMLRCRFAFVQENNQWRMGEFKDVLPRLQLMQDYRVLQDRDEIFKTMAHESFDPRKQVILEREPEPRPGGTAESAGTARIVDSSTDHLTIEADLAQPAILLITDGYSRGWRAVALPGSDQQVYEVLPANYILRAIPLSAGKHRLLVEYSPLAFRVGAWVSSLSLVVFLGLVAWQWRRARISREQRTPPA